MSSPECNSMSSLLLTKLQNSTQNQQNVSVYLPASLYPYILTWPMDVSVSDRRTILVHIGQVDLVAEQHEPLVEQDGRQHNAVGRLAVLAVVVKGLEHQLGCGGAGEVQAYNLG